MKLPEGPFLVEFLAIASLAVICIVGMVLLAIHGQGSGGVASSLHDFALTLIGAVVALAYAAGGVGKGKDGGS